MTASRGSCAVKEHITAWEADGGAVVACSALRAAHRERLAVASPGNICFVFLDAPAGVIRTRLAARVGHYMPPSLLESQLQTLEPPAPGEAIRAAGGAERAAINAPIQGTSADLIKRAMARMDGALADAGLGDVRMLLQVHDELVFEVPDGREAEAAAVIKQVMANAAEPAMKLDVPLDVDVGWGAHWGEAH